MKIKLDTTSGNDRGMCEFGQIVAFDSGCEVENGVVNFCPDVTYETFEGFGGAITEAAAYVYSLLDEKQKQELLLAYFTPERMNYTMVRIHLDSCDFCLGEYEAMSAPRDYALNSFSFCRTEQYILPMLRDVERITGRKPELMLSPWSPPAFMKTNGKRQQGGGLKPACYEMWAAYLCRYIKAFQECGYTVRRISLQNEPHAVQTWDSCVYTPGEQKLFLEAYMYPAMVKAGLEDVEIFLWDHNKERLYEWMCSVIDEHTDSMVAGGAFHWYSGDHFEMLDMVRQRFPDKRLILSESCIELSKYESHETDRACVSLSHEIIGDLNHGMMAFYDWNLLLDEQGGPSYVENPCMAPFHYNRESRKLYAVPHQKCLEFFSHNLVKGSVRIGSSCYTEQIDVTAWKQPDGTLVGLFLNKSHELLPVYLRIGQETASFLLPPRSLTSGVVEAK